MFDVLFGIGMFSIPISIIWFVVTIIRRKTNFKLLLIPVAGLALMIGTVDYIHVESGSEDISESDVELVESSDESVEESVAYDESIESVESEEVKPKRDMVIINEDFIFGETTIELENAQYYTENGADLVDVSFRWINQSGEDEKPFFSLMIYEAFQNDEPLDEVSGLMDDPTFTGSGYYYRANNLISTPLTFTYEVNKDEPIELRFTPTNEFEDTIIYIIEK